MTSMTLLAWPRRPAAAKYDTSKQGKPGRPPTARSIAGLVVRRRIRYRDTAVMPSPGLCRVAGLGSGFAQFGGDEDR